MQITKSPNKTGTKKAKENPFNQLCVIHGCVLNEYSPKDFEEFMGREFDCRFKFAEEVKTLVSQEKNSKRIDLFFWIHDDDISKFATARFRMGVRWWEDIFFNNQGHEYSEKVKKAYPTLW